MNRLVVTAAIVACALGAGVSAKAATTPVDGVKVLVPGQTEIDFLEFSDAPGSPEFFISTTFLPIGFSEATVFLTEPGSAEVSDALSILLNTTGGVDIFFFSDPLTIPLADIAPAQFTIAETGDWQDVSSFFGQPAGFAQVISDIDTVTVPEPATWAMMLAGFGMIGATLRGSRRRRIASTAEAA
jgi:hypothetical protein